MERKVMKQSKKIYWRAVISFYIIIAFIIMSVSGIILYFAPPGRIAFWSEWTFIALTKEQWQAVHTLFTFIFVFAAAFHIYFNWSVITSYLKKRMNEGMRRRNELILASVFSVIVLSLTVGNFPPFSSVMDIGEDLSNSWSDENTEPPVPHAELLTLNEFAEVIKMDVVELINNLQKNGIDVNGTDLTVKELAALNDLTPQDIYERIQTQNTNQPVFVSGSGYGRKSLIDLSKELNLDLNLVLSRLRQNGIEAEPQSNIKNLASEYDFMPIDIVKIIRAKVQLEQNDL
jgi:hypothetical protein